MLKRHSFSSVRFLALIFGTALPTIMLSNIMLPTTSHAAEPLELEQLKLELHSQQESGVGTGRFLPVTTMESWSPSETAIIVCDVWDYHHCLNAVRRLEEFAPRLDAVLKKARDQGVTIIHSPSDCMPAYEGHAARERAMAAPRAKQVPHAIGDWCSQIPSEERAAYPIDQSDGGEDDDPQEHAVWREKLIELGRAPNLPWQRQSALISIDAARDFISDRGDEVWNVLESRGIKNVILTGVHVNMCVLGRPFGLRQMARNGKRVVLMSDMTDAMYNPQRWPYVSHFTGNDLIVSHIERYICPTITSDQILGGEPFRFSKDSRPHVVMVIAEKPYGSHATLPDFAVKALGRDFRVTVLHADEENPYSIPGFEVIRDADLLLLSVRRRLLPEEDMSILREYVTAGKPVIGLRTSSHAFALRNSEVTEGYRDWPEFDADVFGGNYHGSYPDELRSTVKLTPASGEHVVSTGIDETPFVQSGHQYKTGPLRSGANVIMEGSVKGHDADPVAWTYTRTDGGKSFYVALGHPDDFQQASFVRLLANAVYWGVDQAVPESIPSLTPEEEYREHWVNVAVPSTWEGASQGVLKEVDGSGWYRCVLYLSTSFIEKGQPLSFRLTSPTSEGGIRAWVNGKELGSRDGKSFTIARESIVVGDYNLLTLHVPGATSALTAAPVLHSAQREMKLAGRWQFRLGAADAEFENMPLPAKFGGGSDIVFSPEEPMWVARAVTRPGEFTPGIEGPACDAQGNIYAVNYSRQGTIGRVTPDGAGEIFVNLPEKGVGNGIRFGQGGEMFVADYVNHKIWRINPETRAVSLHAQQSAMNQPNDIAIADDGTLYASDPNWKESTGQLWRIDPDGTTTRLANDLGTTNGIEVSPDGKTLYVNESRQRNVWAFTITDEKKLIDKRLIRQFPDHGFDGMRADVDGNLYLTRYGKGTVVKMTPTGEVLREIHVLGMRPSNLCFGGSDGRSVYVTEVESTRLVTFRVDRPGRSWKQFER
ncbi:SMP-30/gluconolactonase/LRE family protein [Thalassoglobus polymorphus]|uniref:Gluconolactonase n=1 Tax=Thalassoglobus polymorphus TaxID=2527994 RepID=A0A517QS65_9PLAN|nr:SMP-30/gluconolactonase/LRE family protein [Thalassoglobus polymorphus]QDT34451.1 Gluconolactonase precursor [Thalassoglobus polymorphus]